MSDIKSNNPHLTGGEKKSAAGTPNFSPRGPSYPSKSARQSDGSAECKLSALSEVPLSVYS